METQRLLLYMALGFLSLIIYQTWMQDYATPAPVERTGEPTGEGVAAPAAADLPQAPTAAAVDGDVGPAGTASAETAAGVDTPSVSVRTDLMNVRISTVGATITTVELLEYPVSIEQPDTPFALVSDDPLRYLVVESGLQAQQGQPAPTHREPMTAEAERYTLGEGEDTIRVPFTWRSPSGVEVVKTLTFTRDSYEVGVDYAIRNGSAEPWSVNQYRQLKRKPGTKDEKQQFVNTYIGGVVSTQEDVYEKVDFGDIEDANLSVDATDGWVAMIQHYFATAWIPPTGEVGTAYTRHLPNENRYLIGLVSASTTIPAGGEATFESRAFIGPKIQERLAEVAPNLELTVDFGFLTILAQPLFWLLKTIHGFIGNWGFAIILVTFCIKAVFYKLSEAGYRSMAKMKLLQPKLTALKERHGDDRAKMGQATMELYKKEKVNPLGGCLPMLVQIPVFIAFYWMLLESVELRQAPWILWIKDLSIKDPLFILPVIMAATMYFQQKLNPAPADPIQAKVFQFLPLVFGIFFAFFPAGLVLYWIANNTLGIAQQYYITRHVLADKEDRGGKTGKTGKKGGDGGDVVDADVSDDVDGEVTAGGSPAGGTPSLAKPGDAKPSAVTSTEATAAAAGGDKKVGFRDIIAEAKVKAQQKANAKARGRGKKKSR